MKLNRKEILSLYPWLRDSDRKFVVSASYDGLICASFLTHHLHWSLEGYYDLSSIWLSENGLKNNKNLIWVDLNILPLKAKSVGGHIVSLDGKFPDGFKSSCNPNILAKLTAKDFKSKFPMSTILFLLWLHNIEIRSNDMAKLLVLNSDDTWLKFQNYKENFEKWITMLQDYRWSALFKGVATKNFEKKIDSLLYPDIHKSHISPKYGRLISKYEGIRSRQVLFNPDWDLDIVNTLLEQFSIYLGWTSPNIPSIARAFNGSSHKIKISDVKNQGIDTVIKKHKIFSYAFSSPKMFSYTTFNKFS
mgnify:CR=1 FL=1